ITRRLHHPESGMETPLVRRDIGSRSISPSLEGGVMHYARNYLSGGMLFMCISLLGSCKDTTELGDTTVNISDPASEALALGVQEWKSFEEKKYPEAVTYFNRAIGKNDQFADAYNGLGWTYGRMDSLDRAAHNFDIALGQQVNFLDAY